MPVSYDKVMALKAPPVETTYTDREVMLYALGIGFGRDPENLAELPFVYEKELRVVPTMAVVLSGGTSPIVHDSGLNYVKMLHGEQRLTIDRPLPTSGTVVAHGRIGGFYDKGADKGALLVLETELRDKATGERLCTVSSTAFFRADGGFGGPSEGAPAPHPIPSRKPDHVVALETRIDQAALYRLSGDRNPLHIDPEVATAAGFGKPILHGLCSYGTACRGVLQTLCGYDPSQIKAFDVRFSSPVYPGETLVTELWQDGRVVSFRCKVKERDLLVINNGRCLLA